MKSMKLSTDTLRKLIRVSLGQEKAELAVVHAKLVNVYTGELLDNVGISITGDRIAYVGTDIQHTIGSATEVIDAQGKTVIPGLIDGHAHLAWFYQPSEFLRFAMTGGTTSIITETMEIFPVAGYEGILDFLEAYRDQPIKIFGTAPAMVSTSPSIPGISVDTIESLMAREDIVGLGESYWQAVLQQPERFLPIFEATLKSGKTLEGHSAGARHPKLSAYAACGISSCHEPINAEEVLDRLRLGIHVMIREGSIRRDLAAISKIKDTGIDMRRLILATDGIESGDLIEKGYMEYLVQKAIDWGFDPIAAIQMATLNVAEHFKLDAMIGGIAPGRYADMIIIPDIRNLQAEYVISNGKIIAKDGILQVYPRKHEFSQTNRNTVQLSQNLMPSDFRIPMKTGKSIATVRVMEMVTDLVTRETHIECPSRDGEILQDTRNNLIKIAAVDRTQHPGKLFTGMIKGFGLKSGAMACSAAWDTSCIIAVGGDDHDLALAVNRIRHLQGGAVICDHGKILAEISLPVFGLISDLPMEALADRSRSLKRAAADLGVSFRDPFLSLVALTGSAIPFLRICEDGYVNLKDGNVVGLFSE